MNKFEKIKSILQSHSARMVNLPYLIDLASYTDDECSVANTVEIINGILYCYDYRDIDFDDEIDPIYKIEDLPDNIQGDILTALKAKLERSMY